MRECNSPHIVKCFEVLRTDEFEIMVLEYCRSGDLFKYIRDKKKLHEAEALAILRQIVRGFAVRLGVMVGAAQE
jgi:serine/threonine protein kinase